MSSRGQMLHVMVQLPNKQEVELKLPEKSPVTDIFALAETHSNPPGRFDPKNCQLFWNGSRLGNNMFLDYYRIPNKAKLVVSRRLKSSTTSGGHGGSGDGQQRAMSASRYHQQQQPAYDQYGNLLPQGFDHQQPLHQNSHNNSRGPSNVASRNTSSLRQSRPASGRQSMNTSFEGRATRSAPHNNINNRPTSPNNNWGNGPDRDGFSNHNNHYTNGSGYPPHYSQHSQGPNHQSYQNHYAGSAIDTAPAADAHPSALHSYRVRELEVQLARSHEQYRVAQDRIMELEASVQRLSLVAKRSLELQQQQASSQFPSVSAAAGLEALRNEYSYETGYMGAAGVVPNSVLRSPPHPSSPNRGGGVGSPHSVASTAAPYNTTNYTAGPHHNNMYTAPAPPPGGAYNDATQQGMQRQLEELRESYRRQSPSANPAL